MAEKPSVTVLTSGNVSTTANSVARSTSSNNNVTTASSNPNVDTKVRTAGASLAEFLANLEDYTPTVDRLKY